MNTIKLSDKLYTSWCVLVVTGLFLLLFPLIFISLHRESWKWFAHKLHFYWCRSFCFLVGIEVDITHEFVPDPKQAYIFCGSHFSVMDNFTIHLLVRNFFAVIGDKSISKLPLYGYVFSKLHLLVNRNNQRSRNKVILQAIRMLKQGRSILISPEGGIISKKPPYLHYPFEDGAFILAIHQQIPIVPLTSKTTYRIVPDVAKPLIYRTPFMATIHTPIETKGMTLKDLDRLKEMTYMAMSKGLGYEPPSIHTHRLTLTEVS